MTERVTALKPVQPTLLTQQIEEVMPSRFAARMKVVAVNPSSTEHNGEHKLPSVEIVEDETEHLAAPVVHISDGEGAFLVDYAYGAGRITVLGDPYVVANNGISSHDNLQLAINLVSNTDGLVAFDEYHQGKGITQNEFASYFAGTPVLPIAAQIILLILFVLWTRARRFARPLPR